MNVCMYVCMLCMYVCMYVMYVRYAMHVCYVMPCFNAVLFIYECYAYMLCNAMH